MFEKLKEFAGPYRIAKVKKLTGRNGSGWSGVILRDCVVIGEAIDDGDGGPLRMYNFNVAERDALFNHSNKVLKDDVMEITEMFLEELVNHEILMESLRKKSVAKIILMDKGKYDINGVPNSFASINAAPHEANILSTTKGYPDSYVLNGHFGEWPVANLMMKK